MSNRQSTRHILADLIKRHYERRIAGAPEGPRSPPSLRLQDWQLLEETAVGCRSYVLLGRIETRKTGFDSLTARERDAVYHAGTGISNKEIAKHMEISDSTVGVLLSRASRKLGATDRSHLIRIVQKRPR